MIYDKPGNVDFESKLERLQYKECLEITGAVQGTNRDSTYTELDLESLSAIRWYQQLLFFYKIVDGFYSACLTIFIKFAGERSHNTRILSERYLEEAICRTKIFLSSLFLCYIKTWNGVNPTCKI